MRRDVGISLALAAAVAIVFGGAAGHAFISLDDPQYIYDNPYVTAGLTRAGAAWAFTSTEQGNWHPLAWLSHMLDWQLFGAWAGGHHLAGVGLHAASSVLLYFVLKRMTRAAWPSATVAALFALHPMHVESVAWAAERKDVLAALFWMLTLGAYARYAERPGAGRYAAVAGLLALGLMAKPMLVTLPCVLLLLDAWPLGRLKRGQNVGRRLLEKLPLAALAAASCVVTFEAQRAWGAVASVDRLPLDHRLANAAVAYAEYLGKAVWPAGLAIYYPYPASIPAWQWAGAAALLATLTAGAVWQARRRPYLAVGWLWFLGTLVPVIGLVQVGGQRMADRYTYIPYIGLFIAAAWGAAGLAGRSAAARRAVGVAAAGAIVLLAAAAFAQVGTWKDRTSVFRHAAGVTENNAVALASLASAVLAEGRTDDAVGTYEAALRADPDCTLALNDYAIVLMLRGEYGRAEALARRSVDRRPRQGKGWFVLGEIFARRGRLGEAVDAHREGLLHEPGRADMYNIIGVLRARQGRLAEAEAAFRTALALAPANADARLHLADALAGQHRLAEALPHYAAAVAARPADARVRRDYGLALARSGRLADAAAEFREALRLEPGHGATHYNLGLALSRQGGVQAGRDAAAEFQEAIRLDPGDAAAANSLAWLRATHPEAALRDGAEAARLAERAAALTGRRNPAVLDTLAAVYAEAGRFPEAVAAAGEARALAEAQGAAGLAADIARRRALYEAGQPYREAAK